MRKYIIIFIILLVIVSYTTSLFNEPKPFQKETIQEEQKTVIDQVVSPSGETHTVTTIVYKKQQQKEVFAPKEKSWYVTVGRTLKPVYQFSVNRKILKDFTVGVYGNTKNEYGIQVGYSF